MYELQTGSTFDPEISEWMSRKGRVVVVIESGK